MLNPTTKTESNEQGIKRSSHQTSEKKSNVYHSILMLLKRGLLVQQCFLSSYITPLLSMITPPHPCLASFVSVVLTMLSVACQAFVRLTGTCTELCIRSHLLQTPPPPKEMEEDPAEELLAEMTSIASKKWTRQPGGSPEVPKSMVASVRRIVKSAQRNHEFTKSLLDFAYTKADEGEKLLKVTHASVPKGILPECYEAVLYDIKVSGREADDSIYSNHPDIRQKIPRGTTVMNLKKGSSSIQDIVIYANRKFTGDIGDEDDTQPESNNQWQKYFLKDQEETQQVVCMKKINGEAAHFSGRFIDGQFYIITGSKNVHMIIKDKEDIDKYEGERYTVAKVVANCVWQTLQALEEKNQKFLQSFLHHTKSTAISELLQPKNQHIMNLSYLEEPLLTVIGFTPPASNEDLGSLVAYPPHHTLDLLSCLGFMVPLHTIIPVEEMQRHREEIRHGKHGFHEEGEVLYFLGKDEETIGLVKTKTTWYIMLRALREKVVYTTRRRQGWSLQERIDSTHRRFMEIQEWLLFSDSYLEGWKKLASSFMKWVEEQMSKGHLTLENIRPTYPIVWNKFLTETNQTDRVAL